MLKKLLILVLVLLSARISYAVSVADFSGVIADSNVNKSGISVSVIDLETGKEEYKLHSKRPLNPASVQKIITYKIAESILGEDYRLETKLYKNKNDE